MTDVRKLLADALVQAAMEDDKSQKVTVSMRVLEIMVAGAPAEPSPATERDSGKVRSVLLGRASTPGSRLRWSRQAMGISAAELATRVGLSESAIRNQENGTNGYSPELAKQYSEILGGAPGWYLFGPLSTDAGPHVDEAVNPDTTP